MNNLLIAIKLTFICLIFFCGIYVLLVYGVAKLFVSNKNPYENIAQSFTQDKYFHPRPSAVNYNAAGSGGSNKSVSNPAYLAEITSKIDTFLTKNPQVNRKDIPSDLITASGSGLDPHISVKAAHIQVKRVAKARNLSENIINNLINECIEQPLLGIFGTTKINVLKLNIKLDQISK